MDYHYSFGFLLEYKEALFYGLLSTLQFTGICIVLGLILGFAVALMRLSESKIIYVLSTAYVEFFRGTPVLIQLFWIFFCLPLILGVEISNFTSSIIALTLYAGANISETFRASIKSIPKDQMDACIALGVGPRVRTLNVILPQAVLRAVPPLLSNCVALFKESALVSAVGMADLMFTGQNISNNTARPVEVLTTVALIYFIIAFPITRSVSAVEKKLIIKVAE